MRAHSLPYARSARHPAGAGQSGERIFHDDATGGARRTQSEEELRLWILVEIVVEAAMLFQKLGDALDDLVEQGGDFVVGGGIEGREVRAGIGLFGVGEKEAVGDQDVEV